VIDADREKPDAAFEELLMVVAHLTQFFGARS
jgi:hypothetical protein